MTVSAQSIVEQLQHTFNDDAGERIPASYAVKLLNRAQRDIHTARPDVTSTLAVILTSPGHTQRIPPEVAQLIDITALAEGSKRAISKVDESLLSATVPNWRALPETEEVRHYMHDVARDNRTFYVYPPAKLNVALRAKYSAYPYDIPEPASPGKSWRTVSGDISLNDEWATTLLTLTMAYAYLTDLEGVANPAMAQTHLQQASTLLGVEIQSKMAVAPQEKD